jgi:hypothetical protein
MAPQDNESVSVEVSAEELKQLRTDSRKLAALEAAGVDNWEHYGDAMRSLHGEDDDF